MRRNLALVVFLLTSFFVVSQQFNLSNKDIDEVVTLFKENRAVDYDAKYLWSGVVREMKIDGNKCEAIVLRAKWSDNQILSSYHFVIKSENPTIVSTIKNIEVYTKIIVFLKILKINEDGIPICEPYLIRKL